MPAMGVIERALATAPIKEDQSRAGSFMMSCLLSGRFFGLPTSPGSYPTAEQMVFLTDQPEWPAQAFARRKSAGLFSPTKGIGFANYAK
jgi:hypothetical protein